MTNTAWFLRDLDTLLIAHPYKWNGSSYYDWGHYGYASYPDGELRTTVRSLSRWLITNINFGKLNDVRVLDSTAVRSMRTVEYWPPDWGGVGLGLVWMTWAFPNGRWVWYHDGRDYGVSTTLNLDEVQETGVIILTNVNPINENDFLSLQNTLFMVADTLTVSIRPLEDNGLPKDFTLRQNYPNPFNPTTTIKYSIPQSSKVVIKVYDVLGNEIETIVNEEKPAGTYELTWNAENLPSGVYFYQFKAGSYVNTKKMLLLK
jgi:CubicO group peptidase (beta-lactamase class C family)